MSILIKGMKMPKNCDECPLYTCMHNHDNCPLVPVPEHGRLIDADALAEDGWVLTKQVMRMGGYAIHELPLKNPSIPVIIPAEEGET